MLLQDWHENHQELVESYTTFTQYYWDKVRSALGWGATGLDEASP